MRELRETFRELKKRKGSFVLGILSIFVSVWVSASMHTALSHAPLVFLTLAEADSAQTDMFVSPGEVVQPGLEPQFVNYSAIAAALEPLGAAFSFHAPRITLPAKAVSASVNSNASMLAAEAVKVVTIDYIYVAYTKEAVKVLGFRSACIEVTT